MSHYNNASLTVSTDKYFLWLTYYFYFPQKLLDFQGSVSIFNFEVIY